MYLVDYELRNGSAPLIIRERATGALVIAIHEPKIRFELPNNLAQYVFSYLGRDMVLQHPPFQEVMDGNILLFEYKFGHSENDNYRLVVKHP